MKRKDRNKAPEISTPVDAQLYAAWIKYAFDRPTTWPLWCNDTNLVDFEAPPEILVAIFGQTFARSGIDLLVFSDAQVSHGLKYIFDNGVSNAFLAFADDELPERLRVHSIAQIKHLYRDCFAKRCANILSHLDEPGGEELNSLCYMLWDISPLLSSQDVLLEVLEDALYIPHDACIESALHGLGHLVDRRDRAEEIIDRFLARTPHLRPELMQYAKAARSGCVQ